MRVDRAVIDTNVLISAALRPEGPPRRVLDAMGRNRSALIFSDETFSELRSRLHRPKFDRYLSQSIRTLYLSQIMAVSEWVSITNAKMGCRDPDDDKFLETALMGNADCIVTGDRDVLDMPAFHSISILAPSEFLSRLHSGQ
ncbi:MAG: putative toxin-antitoxin system toxin component, PIN family [Gammaproteobacteria bacterium]|nr:putative toxin-antitoxin system toxin component, PIN family [Gammaproteobacteria bacterium]MDE0272689.1 putative toxin-antitoxin system toxin component, PIN family [Gammaproteobacteria bacterium]